MQTYKITIEQTVFNLTVLSPDSSPVALSVERSLDEGNVGIILIPALDCDYRVYYAESAAFKRTFVEEALRMFLMNIRGYPPSEYSIIYNDSRRALPLVCKS